MKLIRYNNLHDRAFGHDLNSMLASFFDGNVMQPRGAFSPAVDIAENETAYLVKAELPGIKREDLKVEVKDNTLVLAGERKFEQEVKRENFHRIERSFGNFTRSFVLPNNVDTQKVEAKFEDGVLNVTIPKLPESQPQGIKIQ